LQGPKKIIFSSFSIWPELAMIKKEKRFVMLEKVKREVEKILSADQSGHGMDHIERVCRLSQKFAKEEKADPGLLQLNDY
jgi:HD superfamily phosphodiesterase